jgi:hypothetical protein
MMHFEDCSPGKIYVNVDGLERKNLHGSIGSMEGFIMYLKTIIAFGIVALFANNNFAQEPPPPPPPVDCLEFICTHNAERLEAFLTDEIGFCYKVELTCGESLGGGVRLNMGYDGGVGLDYGFFVPDPYEECGGFLWHIENEKFVHSCAFNSGDRAHLEVKAVPMRRCEEEVAWCPPPPPPPPE